MLAIVPTPLLEANLWPIHSVAHHSHCRWLQQACCHWQKLPSKVMSKEIVDPCASILSLGCCLIRQSKLAETIQTRQRCSRVKFSTSVHLGCGPRVSQVLIRATWCKGFAVTLLLGQSGPFQVIYTEARLMLGRIVQPESTSKNPTLSASYPNGIF